MSFPCGCQVTPGAPVPPKIIKEHYKHTIEVLLFWELLQRPGTPLSGKQIDLGLLRINYQEAIEKLYPEAKID